MDHSFPNLRNCGPPPFITEKHGDIAGLINAVLGLGEAEGLPPFPREAFAQVFPAIENVFDSTRASLTKVVYQLLPEAQAHEDVEGEETRPDPRAVAAARYCTLLQRLMLWAEPSDVLLIAKNRLANVVAGLPRTFARVSGAGGRDPLDPFIVAFAELLLKTDSPRRLLEIVVLHKCLMKLEDAIGHLHEEVLGRAGGHERVPEPRGLHEGGTLNKERWHATLNPFPGADARLDHEEFYQIKNKTGSARQRRREARATVSPTGREIPR